MPFGWPGWNRGFRRRQPAAVQPDIAGPGQAAYEHYRRSANAPVAAEGFKYAGAPFIRLDAGTPSGPDAGMAEELSAPGRREFIRLPETPAPAPTFEGTGVTAYAPPAASAEQDWEYWNSPTIRRPAAVETLPFMPRPRRRADLLARLQPY